MPVERARVIPFFKDIHLFAGLDDAQLSKVAGYFREKDYTPDQVIFKQGARADAFYMIMEGEVLIWNMVNHQERRLDVLRAGDYFGEEALLRTKPRSASARAVGAVHLLVCDLPKFKKLIAEYPQVKAALERIIYSHSFVRSHSFPWLNANEAVYQVRRKHGAFLVISLILPTLVLLLGSVVLSLSLGLAAENLAVARYGAIGIGGLISVGGLGWFLWNWLDWSNDYYIVTSQRVVWIERVIMLYESQVEAPLDAVRGIQVTTTLLGRILGYGDVIVSTYTGKLRLMVVGDPTQMEALIREFWRRVQRQSQVAAKAETEAEVMRVIGRPVPKPETAIVTTGSTPTGEARELPLRERLFGNLMRLRYEAGDTITYRKHWLQLLRKAWQPSCLIVILFLIFAASTWLAFIGAIPGGLLTLLAGVLLLVFIVAGIWWVYNYVDWSNDIYQITKDNIYDIERRPLGDENRTSTSLDKVISLSHERNGFIGYILNVGNVEINVGDAKLTFDGVYQPARMQQDVFSRMQMQQAAKQRAEVTRERDRILSLLEIYHQKVNEDPEDNQV